MFYCFIFYIKKKHLYCVMISYILFFMNLFDLYMMYNDMSCFFMDKNFIKEILDFLVILKYTFYVLFKSMAMKLHYYYLMIYTILVLPNVPFILFMLKHFYIMKKDVMWYMRYIKFMSKSRKWFSLYYKFHSMYYFKMLFFMLFFMLFMLMWSRSSTYLKRSIIIRLLVFYFLSLYLSDFFVILFDYSMVGYLLALFMSFFMVYMTLN